MKHLLLIGLVLQSFIILAAQCKVHGCSRYAKRSGYCSFHKNEEKQEVLQDESQKNRVGQYNLKLKSFVGYKFLSKGGSGEIKTCKLSIPFRGFDEAKLFYSSMGRLYQICLEDAVEGRTGEEIQNELASIAAIFEKKYNFTFPKPLSCDNGISVMGGGHYIGHGGQLEHAPIKYSKLKITSWNRNMEWEDFKLNLHGERPNGSHSTNDITRLKITFTMKGIKEADKKQAAQKATKDTDGIDAL